MKSIKLFGPTIVAGDVRHAHENPLTVSNREAAKLKAAGVLAEDPADAPGGEPIAPSGEAELVPARADAGSSSD